MVEKSQILVKSTLNAAINTLSIKSLSNDDDDNNEDDNEDIDEDIDEEIDTENNDNSQLTVYTSNEITISESYSEVMPMSHNQFDNPKAIVLIDILSGYTFRQNSEFHKQALTEAPIYCREHYLDITRSNGDNTLVNSDRIYAKKLVNYYVNKSLWNRPEEKAHHINCDLKEFYGHIKSVAKKQGVRLYQYEQWPDILFGQIYGGTKTSNGFFTIKTQAFKPEKYNIEDGYNPGDKPNIKIPLTAFCDACGKVYKQNYPAALIKCFPNGALLTGASQTGSSTCIERWGDCTIPVQHKSRLSVNRNIPNNIGCHVGTVKPELVKSLSKLNNLCTDGIISIFCSQTGLVRLEVDIGVIGDKIIHLIDAAEE